MASYPGPLISRDFILTDGRRVLLILKEKLLCSGIGTLLQRLVNLTQIEIMKKSKEKRPGDITPPKFQITSRELSFGGH